MSTDINIIATMAAQGWSDRKIADHLLVSRGWVCSLRGRHGIPSKLKMPEVERKRRAQQVRRVWKKDPTAPAIAKALGVSRQRAYQIIDSMGLTKPTQRGRSE